MKPIIPISFALASLPFSFCVQAQQQVLTSNQSFSGLVFTPNAQVINPGDFAFSFGRGVPLDTDIARLDSLNFSLGLFPGMEASGRIVTKTYDNNLFTDSDGGIRDLSASFKYQIPAFWQDWGALDGLNLAVGMQDVGGAANNFDTRYAVADYSFDFLPIRLSAGYGTTKIEGSVMDGAFGGIEVQPTNFLQLVGEYDGVEYNTMVKVFTPQGILPWNMQASLGLMVSSGHEIENDHQVWQSQIVVPLAGDYVNRETQLSNQLSLQDKLQLALDKSDSASLTGLKHALEDEGFLNVRLGTQNKKLFVMLENRRYNHNQVDGLGVALGIISSHYSETSASELGLSSDEFTVVALHNQIPVVKVAASAATYRTFIRDGGNAQGLMFSTSDMFNALDNVQWLGDKTRSGFGRTQLIVSPGLRYAVATEYGVFDYSLGLETNTYTSLWPGAAIDLRYVTPVSDSDDYDHGYWRNAAYESNLDRAQFHQAINLPFDLRYQFSYGLVYTDYLGFKNDAAWYSPSGRHMLGAEVGSYSHVDDKNPYGLPYEDHDIRLARYTYSQPEWGWQLDVKGGEFWAGDEGYQVTTNHWFGDVRVYASYLESKFEDSEKEKFLTLGVAFPLTLWRDMSPNYVQLRGIDEFNFSIQTRIDEDHNQLNQGSGGTVPFQHGLEREYFNRGRYGSGYFENQTVRLRNAYLRWLDNN